MTKGKIQQNLVNYARALDQAAQKQSGVEAARDVMDKSALTLPERLRRGRGATLNPAGRFENETLEIFYDGWGDTDQLQSLNTSVQVEDAKTIITTNRSPDIAFDQSINLYRGCEHGCIYCFARPSHSYLGLSAGLDFETKLFVKPNAANLLKRELERPGYRPRLIAIGTNTDPYQPIEKKWALMREVLTVLQEFHHPVLITTKSALILRDQDLLAAMAGKNLVRVALTITTLDAKLARAMEPRAATPQRRLFAISELTKRSIPVAVMVAPIIPGLNDHELEKILSVAKQSGAVEASYTMLRLPFEVAPLFKDWLLREFPHSYRRIMRFVREMHGGKDYDAEWFKRMHAEGAYAQMIEQRFRAHYRRLKFSSAKPAFDFSAFKTARHRQPNLFGEL